MESEIRSAAKLPAGIAVLGDDGEELTQRAYGEPPHPYRTAFALSLIHI